jgi:hypothetical protein
VLRDYNRTKMFPEWIYGIVLQAVVSGDYTTPLAIVLMLVEGALTILYWQMQLDVQRSGFPMYVADAILPTFTRDRKVPPKRTGTL